MQDSKHFDSVLTRTNLAFSNSPTKGIIFWYNVLLPKSEANDLAHNKGLQSLKESVQQGAGDQLMLVEQIVSDLLYIREQVLNDDMARKKVEELKSFLLQTIAFEEVKDSLQEYVFNNYDTIKAELETNKK